jgi:hypothetical protein
MSHTSGPGTSTWQDSHTQTTRTSKPARAGAAPVPASEHMRSCALIVLEGNGRAAWGRWQYIVLQSVQGYKCRCCRVLGEPGLMGDYETKERSNACSGRGQAARGLAAHDR